MTFELLYCNITLIGLRLIHINLVSVGYVYYASNLHGENKKKKTHQKPCSPIDRQQVAS